MKYILTIILALFTFNAYAASGMKSGQLENTWWIINYDIIQENGDTVTYMYAGNTEWTTLTDNNDGLGAHGIDFLTEAEFTIFKDIVGDQVESGLYYQSINVIASNAEVGDDIVTYTENDDGTITKTVDKSNWINAENKIKQFTNTGMFNTSGVNMLNHELVTVSDLHSEPGIGGATANLISYYRPDSGKTNSIFWAHDIEVDPYDFLYSPPGFDVAYMSHGNDTSNADTSSTVIETIIAADLIKAKFNVTVGETKDILMATLDADRRINILSAQAPIGNVD